MRLLDRGRSSLLFGSLGLGRAAFEQLKITCAYSELVRDATTIRYLSETLNFCLASILSWFASLRMDHLRPSAHPHVIRC